MADTGLGRFGFAAREVSFEVPFVDDGAFSEAIDVEEREIRFQLAPGQVFPKDVHRGRTIDMDFTVGPTTHTFRGRVKFRRLGTMVVFAAIGDG